MHVHWTMLKWLLRNSLFREQFVERCYDFNNTPTIFILRVYYYLGTVSTELPVNQKDVNKLFDTLLTRVTMEEFVVDHRRSSWTSDQ